MLILLKYKKSIYVSISFGSLSITEPGKFSVMPACSRQAVRFKINTTKV